MPGAKNCVLLTSKRAPAIEVDQAVIVGTGVTETPRLPLVKAFTITVPAEATEVPVEIVVRVPLFIKSVELGL
jgi:hypothetical protein